MSHPVSGDERPTYAATAHYHGKLGDGLQNRSLEEVIDEAEAFAEGPYAEALLRGGVS